MDESIISRKSLLALALLSILIAVVLFLQAHTTITTVVFCDVGQGDGIYVRTERGTDILIDAGPTNSILNCLGKYMPFYDHTIEYVILSHAHLDHYGGFEEIANRYTIKTFFYSFLPHTDPSFNYLVKRLKSKGVGLTSLKNTDVLNLDSTSNIKFIWPTSQFINSFNEKKDDLNDTSLVGIFSVGELDILFTGDISPDSTKHILSSFDESHTTQNHLRSIEVLKVPHHGSVNGLTPELLNIINPYLSVASVAQKNKFNHPSQEIVRLFQETHRTFLTTAEQGSIVLSIQNNSWIIHFSRT